MNSQRLKERAYGKVNLGLAVLTRRGDGFHEVETLMVPVNIYDDVVVTVSAGSAQTEPKVVVRGGMEAGSIGTAAPVGAEGLVWDETNLVHKAAEAYLNAHGSAGVDVAVQVTKRLPVAAGMGGGSSDAAAVLRALNAWDASTQPGGQPRLNAQQLSGLALSLGSDVPFFLTQLPAVARGRGERLTNVHVPALELVLINPGIQISAVDAYAALVGFTPRLREARAFQRMAEGLDPGWSNGLQPGVLRMYPELRSVMAELRAAELKGVLMSGSGSTCFGVASSHETAVAAAEHLAQAHPHWWVRAARTVS